MPCMPWPLLCSMALEIMTELAALGVSLEVYNHNLYWRRPPWSRLPRGAEGLLDAAWSHRDDIVALVGALRDIGPPDSNDEII